MIVKNVIDISKAFSFNNITHQTSILSSLEVQSLLENKTNLLKCAGMKNKVTF